MDSGLQAYVASDQRGIDKLVRRFLEQYRVYKGSGGVVVMIDEERCVRTSTSFQIVTTVNSSIVNPQDRAAFWRQLRASEGVQELIDVTVQRPHADTYTQVEHDVDVPGWYHYASGKPPQLISPYAGFALVDLQYHVGYGVDMAVNTKLGHPQSWHGYLGEERTVFWPLRGFKPPLMSLVLCPLGVSREFRVVVGTTRGTRVLMFDVRREGGETKFESIPPPAHRPYIVATDSKGRVRVFLWPPDIKR